MDVQQLFLQRYTVLYDFWLDGFWEMIPDASIRVRPHPRVNSIAWNLWHVARVEDSALNRFIVDRSQVLDDEPWLQRMNVPWRHNGSEMTFAEVDELSQRIDLQALQGYFNAVHRRTLAIIGHLDTESLDETLQAEWLRMILFDEGLAGPRAAGLLENYTGWTKGKTLMNLGLTHSYQHVGEMGVIASLLDVDMG